MNYFQNFCRHMTKIPWLGAWIELRNQSQEEEFASQTNLDTFLKVFLFWVFWNVKIKITKTYLFLNISVGQSHFDLLDILLFISPSQMTKLLHFLSKKLEKKSGYFYVFNRNYLLLNTLWIENISTNLLSWRSNFLWKFSSQVTLRIGFVFFD